MSNDLTPAAPTEVAYAAAECLVRTALGCSTLTSLGPPGAGFISVGQGYHTERGDVFVKINSKPGAKLMFDGEAASLEAISATNTIRVPQPIKVLDNPKGGAVNVLEYLDIREVGNQQSALGQQIAKMHKYNEDIGIRLAKRENFIHRSNGDGDKGPGYMTQFGFHTTTCCGFIPQDNTWEDDWMTFFTRNKLQLQMDLIENNFSDQETRTLWGLLQRQIPKFFRGVRVTPALVHGDLHGRNVGSTEHGPVTYDPGSLYGHSEFDLPLAKLYGGFEPEFFEAYHEFLPKQRGFESRQKLYGLFHGLNKWNHFGNDYKEEPLRTMKALLELHT